MDIIKSIKDMLALQAPYAKRSRLQYLSDVFEFDKWLKEKDIVEGVKILLFCALREKDQDVKKAFFRTIHNAVVYHQKEDIGKRVNWDGLIDSLSTLNKCQLEYALNILSLSGQGRYVPMLEEYAQHIDPEIGERAGSAIREIKSRLANAADAQMEASWQNMWNG